MYKIAFAEQIFKSKNDSTNFRKKNYSQSRTTLEYGEIKTDVLLHEERPLSEWIVMYVCSPPLPKGG